MSHRHPRLRVRRATRLLLSLVATVAGLGAGLGVPAARAAGPWSVTGALAKGRDSPATLLRNGDVLLTGGRNGGPSTRADLYHPSTGTWTRTGSLNTARFEHNATLLPNGKVLVVGSSVWPSSDYDALVATLRSAELYDPASGRWSTTGFDGRRPLLADPHAAPDRQSPRRRRQDARRRRNGTTDKTATAELYDPATNRWTATAPMAGVRRLHTATLLQNGRVLIAGGQSEGGVRAKTVEIYTPAR